MILAEYGGGLFPTDYGALKSAPPTYPPVDAGGPFFYNAWKATRESFIKMQETITRENKKKLHNEQMEQVNGGSKYDEVTCPGLEKTYEINGLYNSGQ